MSEMLELVLDDLNDRIKKIEDSLKKQLLKVRTGRASLSILEDVKASYYGQLTPIRQMANVTVPEPRLLVVVPFDPSAIKDIEKAIQAADLGINPLNDGKVIRLVIPELSEERRRDLTRLVKKIAEEHRVSIRQARRDSNEELKKAEKAKDITEDDLKQGLDKIQKSVDKAIEAIDKVSAAKEKELLEI
jgi:ribosome recycling factor